MDRDTQCYQCQRSSDEVTLSRCPVCHRRFCNEHAFHMSGRPFCSSGCAQVFFFEDPDE